MMKKKIFVVAAVFVSIHLQAQKDSTKILDEVVITASKFPQKQSTTGKVITVISKEEIERSSGRTIAQLLNEQAGITINGALNNAGSNQSVFMRGASGGRTLILLDGIPVSDPSLINNEFDLNLISMNNVERIEICRGAQSTLYGSDAIAGVINIITVKQDIVKPVNIKAMITGGNYGSLGANLQCFGKLSNLVYTFRYASQRTAGYSAAYDSIGNRGFDNDKFNSHVFSGVLKYQFSPAVAVKAFIQSSRYNSAADAGIFTDEKDISLRNRSLITGASIHVNRGKLNFTANYQYSDILRNYLNDSLDQPGFIKYSTDDYFGKNQFVEAFVNIQFAKRFTLLQGADYRYGSMNNQYFSISSYGPFSNEFRDTLQNQASLYTSLFYSSLSQKLHIELGGRLNVHSLYGNRNTFTFNPSYSINEQYRIFGSIASAFKVPSLYQLYSQYGNHGLKPETGTTIEFGLEQHYAAFKNRVVYFNRVITNGIDFDNNIFQYFNINRQTVNGLEWETVIRPVKPIEIHLNYTYLASLENSQSRVTFKDTSYHYLLRRPRHNFNINFVYHYSQHLLVSISGKYISKRFDVGGYKLGDIALNSYFLLNAYAEYQVVQGLKCFLTAQNITNRRFFDLRGYNSMPFLINLGLVYNWQE